PDAIVGKMTIASLDRDTLAKQGQPAPPQSSVCGSDQPRPLSSVSAGSALAATRVGARVASLRDSVGGPPTKQPHELALSRVGDAASAIAQTRAVLAGLINFRPPAGAPVLPPGTMVLFDKVWRNFGMPVNFPFDGFGEFPPINSRTQFLQAIDSH